MTLTLFQGHIGVKLVGIESVKLKLCLATSCCTPEEITHVGTLHSDQYWREVTDQLSCLNDNLLTLAYSFFFFFFPLPNCSAKSLQCFKMVTLFDPVATEHLLWRCPLQVSPRVPQGQKLCTWEREKMHKAEEGDCSLEGIWNGRLMEAISEEKDLCGSFTHSY